MDLFTKYDGEELKWEDYYPQANKVILEHMEEMNPELFAYYRLFLKKCGELASKIAIPNNSISLMSFLDSWIWHGFFSYKCKFKYNDKVGDILSFLNGAQVVTGTVACRHIADFSADLFGTIGEQCEVFVCYYSHNFDEPLSLIGEKNHSINIIQYGGIYYGYDATNHSFFTFDSPMSLVGDKAEVYWKPQLQVFMGLSLEGIRNRLEWYKRSSESTMISTKELEDIKNNTIDNIKKRKDLIYDFALDTGPIKAKIYEASKHVKID